MKLSDVHVGDIVKYINFMDGTDLGLVNRIVDNQIWCYWTNNVENIPKTKEKCIALMNKYEEKWINAENIEKLTFNINRRIINISK